MGYCAPDERDEFSRCLQWAQGFCRTAVNIQISDLYAPKPNGNDMAGNDTNFALTDPLSKTQETRYSMTRGARQALRDRLALIRRKPELSTLRYLARFLRPGNDPDETLEQIAQRLETQYNRHYDLPRLTSTVRFMLTVQGTGRQVSLLVNLPNELLVLLRDVLPPASVVCLAQTCRHMHGILHLSLADVNLFAFASVHQHRVPAMDMRAQVFQATTLLDRDRVASLHRRESPSDSISGREGMLACEACTDLHPATSFSPSGRESTWNERQCLASKRYIRISPNWVENFAGLRALRRALLSESDGDITRSSSNPFASRRQFDDNVTLSVNSRDQLIIHRIERVAYCAALDHTDLSDLTAVTNTFLRTTGRDLRLCPHTSMGGLPALSIEDLRGQRRSHCQVCKTSWWFWGEWMLQMRTGLVFWVCDLNVQRVVGDLKDPWDEEYLALAEDPESLIRRHDD